MASDSIEAFGASETASATGATPARSERVDVAVIGAGIVGLATAYELLRARPGLRLAVIEREADVATHQSGHNSGVLHAGIYYAPGSLKARLCREGKAALEAYATEHGIPFERCGKLVVAVDEDELPRLQALHERAAANGVPGLEVVGPERLREIEPHAIGIQALWSPTTGIIDFRAVCLALVADIVTMGGEIHTSRRVVALRTRGSETVVETSTGDLCAKYVVACAGLWADDVAAMTDRATGRATRDRARIVPFRGDYYTLTPDARPLVRGLIYPLADPRFPFLGVHFTRRIDGEVWAGPNAVLAFARTGYRRTDLNVRELAAILRYRGFLRLALRFWPMGLAEYWRDVSKGAFLAALRRYVPELRADQLVFGPSGVRAQALDVTGALVDDFRFGGTDRVLHVRNAPSPAATASLAIGGVLRDRAIERFGL